MFGSNLGNNIYTFEIQNGAKFDKKDMQAAIEVHMKSSDCTWLNIKLANNDHIKLLFLLFTGRCSKIKFTPT